MSFCNQSSTSRKPWILQQHVLGMSLLIATLLTLVIPSLDQAIAATRTLGIADHSTSIGSATSGVITKVSEVNPTTLPILTPSASRHTHSMPILYPYATPQQHAAEAEVATLTPAAPKVQSGTAQQEGPLGLTQNFLGLTAVDDSKVNKADFEPPDQGLCIGPGSSGTGAVLETVNDVMKIYSSTGGSLQGAIGLSTFFNEPLDTLTEPRCFYDPTVHTWFYVILAFDSLGHTESHLDLAVNTTTDPLTTWTIYRLDTTDPSHPNCPCIGDQPLLGVDAHGVFLSTNEFDLATGRFFNGAQLYAIDKKQLVALASHVYFVPYSNLMNGGTKAASMEPAITTSSSPAEYFLDSLDPSGTTDNRLGVWAITNDVVLDTMGTPTLSGIVITSQTYGLPPNALQKGTTNQLQADDDRMLQVQNVGGTLWSSLDTVALPSGDTTNRAGAAWFEIVPKLNTHNPPQIIGATIMAQGILALGGEYLLYPAIAVNDINDAVMVFSETGSQIYPSIYYATGSTFTSTVLVASGATFDNGYTCSPCRWGDYSAAVWSSIPSGKRLPYIWMASAYVVNSGDGVSNWATRIAEAIPLGG